MKTTIALTILTILSIGTLAGGFLFPVVVEENFEKGLASQLVIDSKDHPDYDDWVTNTDEWDTPKYRNYYLFNMTNPQAYLLGSTPEFDELGPYAFRQYDTKFNVRFEDEFVTYAKYTYFVFDSNRSFHGADLSDQITNINSGYLGVLDQLGSETNLLVSFVGPTVGELMQGLKTDFTDNVVYQATPDSILGFRDQISGSMGDLFYTQWANGSISDVDLNGDSTDDLNIGPSNITTDQAKALFNENNTMAFTNLQGFSTWIMGNASTLADLAATFGISVDQATLVQIWLADILGEVVPALLVDQFGPLGVADITDLGYLQWTSSVLTNGVSLKDLDANVQYYPELWSYASNVADSPISLTLSQAKSLFEGAMNISDPVNVGTFLSLLESGEFSQVSQLWELNSTEAVVVGGYLQYVMSTFVSDFLKSMQAIGGGLLTTYSITEWLFENTDPFLSLLAPDAADTSFFNNQTSATDLSIDPPSTFNTGSRNLQLAGAWVADQEEEVITEYAEDITVEGSNGEFFGMDIDKDDELKVYADDLKRVIPLEFVEESSVEGIETLRFTFSKSALQSGTKNPENAKFYHHTSGFFNITALAGLQILLSNPRFYDVPRVDVEVPPANPDDHTSFLDIEPTTGLAISAAKRLQFNVVVNATDTFYTAVPDAIVPLMWIEETGELSKADAAEFRDSIETYLLLREFSGPGLFGFGAILGVATIALVRRYR